MTVEALDVLADKIAHLKDCHSLTKKHLTKAIVDKYKSVKTKGGATLGHCIVHNAHHATPKLPRCADVECYETFADFFNPVIKDYHQLKEIGNQPASNFGDLGNLGFDNIDASGKYVLSTRVRIARSVKGFHLAPIITKEDRTSLESKLSAALGGLSGHFKGSYKTLSGIDKATHDQLVKDHHLFKDDDAILKELGAHRDWPSGRGYFHSDDNSLFAWVNGGEDHFRLFTIEKGGHLGKLYKTLAEGVKAFDAQKMEFVHCSKLGYINFCPSNLGSGFRASAYIKLPMCAKLPNFHDICHRFNLRVQKEHPDSVFDVGNKHTIGVTEIQSAKEFAAGVAELIRLEKDLDSQPENHIPSKMPVESLDYMAEILWRDGTERSYAKKHLSKAIVEKYRNTRTKLGNNLSHCIRNTTYNPCAICPRMGDPECYAVFVDYLDPLIKDYHKVTTPEVQHPAPSFGDLNNLPFGDLDPSGKFVVSTRVRVGRSIEGFSFPTSVLKDDRARLEKLIGDALKNLTGEHVGTYYPLTGMDEKVQRQLIDDHFLFKDDDPVLRDAGGYREWPHGRGIFHNANKTFLVWCHEEDHMRIISMQQGGNLKEVYHRLISGIQAVEKHMAFAHHPKYGYLTCCPSNLGTTMRASVLVRVPKLAADYSKLVAVCDKFNLQPRGFYGEHTESPEGIYDISNKRRLGYTELEAAMEMAAGVLEVIKIESSM